jgi:hypothetical protein
MGGKTMFLINKNIGPLKIQVFGSVNKIEILPNRGLKVNNLNKEEVAYYKAFSVANTSLVTDELYYSITGIIPPVKVGEPKPEVNKKIQEEPEVKVGEPKPELKNKLQKELEEKLAKEKALKELKIKADKEKADKEKADKEKADKEKADKEKADKEKADKEKAKIKADKEKIDKEKIDKEKS